MKTRKQEIKRLLEINRTVDAMSAALRAGDDSVEPEYFEVLAEEALDIRERISVTGFNRNAS